MDSVVFLVLRIGLLSKSNPLVQPCGSGLNCLWNDSRSWRSPERQLIHKGSNFTSGSIDGWDHTLPALFEQSRSTGTTLGTASYLQTFSSGSVSLLPITITGAMGLGSFDLPSPSTLLFRLISGPQRQKQRTADWKCEPNRFLLL